MTRPLFASAVAGIVACLAAGCFWLPVATGPSYAWQANRFPAATDSVFARFEDSRPAWERQYRALPEAPGAWRKGVGFIPAENIQPSPIGILQGIVTDSVARVSRETTVTFRLLAFRVVLNDIDRKHEQRDEESQVAAAGVPDSRGFHFGVFVSSGMGFGAGVPGDSPVDHRLGGGQPPPRVDREVKPIFMRDYQLVHGTREYYGPPPELPATFDAGTTCEIIAEVVLESPGAPPQSIPLHVVQRVGPPASFTARLADDLPMAIAGAIEQFAAQLSAALMGRPQSDPAAAASELHINPSR